MASRTDRQEPLLDRLARWAGRGTSRRDVMKAAGAGAMAYLFLPGRADFSFAQTGRCDACFYTYQRCMNPKLDDLKREYKAMTWEGVNEAKQRSFEAIVGGHEGRGKKFIGGVKDGEFGYQIGIAIRQRYKLGQAREACREEERRCMEQNPPCGRCQECDANGACQPCSANCKLCDFDTGVCGASICGADQKCCDGRCVAASEPCCPPQATTCSAGGDVNCCYAGETCCATPDRALCCPSWGACCHSTYNGQNYADCYDPSTHKCCPGGVAAIAWECF